MLIRLKLKLTASIIGCECGIYRIMNVRSIKNRLLLSLSDYIHRAQKRMNANQS